MRADSTIKTSIWCGSLVERIALIILLFVALLSFAVLQPSVHAASQDVSAASENTEGKSSYRENCAVCHGDEAQGRAPYFPSLTEAVHQWKERQLVDLVRHGIGRMPAFPERRLPDAELGRLLSFIAESPDLNKPVDLSVGARTDKIPGELERSNMIFQQYCSFCHGKDAAGGDTGPDLTRSRLVTADVSGQQISQVIHNGRPEKGMPRFSLDDEDTFALVQLLHYEAKQASAGRRRGVDASDLQTGNVEKGREYFTGKGGCSGCHLPAGDLAGVASRRTALELELQMLCPRDVVKNVTVTTYRGRKVKGKLEYLDEFTLALRDEKGNYNSWSTETVTYSIDSPADAHISLLGKYTDDDIHNLMAYLQTFK